MQSPSVSGPELLAGQIEGEGASVGVGAGGDGGVGVGAGVVGVGVVGAGVGSGPGLDPWHNFQPELTTEESVDHEITPVKVPLGGPLVPAYRSLPMVR